jgi:hypothetical protein
MIGDTSEVIVGCEHREGVAYAQLSQQRIDRSDLHAGSAAMIPQFRRPDVIVAIGHEQGHRRKSVYNLITALWSREALKQFLKHEARRQNSFAAFDCLDQRPDLRTRSWRVAPQRERPDTGVDKEAQSRARPAL